MLNAESEFGRVKGCGSDREGALTSVDLGAGEGEAILIVALYQLRTKDCIVAPSKNAVEKRVL